MTTIHLDDDLVAETMRCTGLVTRDDAVAAGLRLMLQLDGQAEAIRELKGSFEWHGDLTKSRVDVAPVE